ncbi:hypothetical protein [Lentzea sp. NPDC059081]|uniref:hypothetical protein n=1 Tax=Lentzea sp. NPDC059081 TaxID=3346719 RepID=UPI0036CC551A
MDQSQIPPGSVVITPAELYAEVKATHLSVTEMRGDVRELTKIIPDHEERLRALEQREDSAELATDVQDHETRLRSVERARWLIAGFAAGGGGVIGSVVTKLLGG